MKPSSNQPSPIGETLDLPTVGRLIGMFAGLSAGQRVDAATTRRAIADQLARIIDADVWMWARSRMPTEVAQPVIFDSIEGGFRDEAERAAFICALYDPAISEAYNRSLQIDAGMQVPGGDGDDHPPRTRPLDTIMPDGSPQREQWRTRTGLSDGIVCMVPLGGPSWSGIGFHRREGRTPFTMREIDIVHLVMAQLGPLHRAGTDVPANSDVLFQFRPRERQVLLYLIAGDSTKQIAAKLGLSHHTVGDYVKVIYRRLRVSTRAELLRLFMPGGQPARPPSFRD